MSAVSTSTTDTGALATASLFRTRAGVENPQDGTLVAIGGGTFLTAGHVLYQYSNPATPRTAENYRFSVADGMSTDRDVTIISDRYGADMINAGWGTEGGSDVAFVFTNDATVVDLPMLVYAEANDAAGTLTTFGYPVAGGYDGTTMVEATGALSQNMELTVDIGSGRNVTVLTSDIGMQVYSGQSGSGMWLTNDIDGDGIQERYLAGVVSLDITYVGGAKATGFEPLGDIYTALALEMADHGIKADAIARSTLVSGQQIASSETSVIGTYLHEDIIGGINVDTLDGGAGNDRIYGKSGNDILSGGLGRDRIEGGDGDDIISDGNGKDNLFGGDGADTFIQASDRKIDVIRDFENGIDTIDIAGWGAASFTDLTITQQRAGKILVTHGADRVLIRDTGRELQDTDLDATDFTFMTPGLRGADIVGTAARDKLFGSALGETIIDGAEIDKMFGRGGADTFQLVADGHRDIIKDFDITEDTLDISAWGATSRDDLTFKDHHTGKVFVRYADEFVAIDDGSRTLTSADLTADLFVFA